MSALPLMVVAAPIAVGFLAILVWQIYSAATRRGWRRSGRKAGVTRATRMDENEEVEEGVTENVGEATEPGEVEQREAKGAVKESPPGRSKDGGQKDGRRMLSGVARTSSGSVVAEFSFTRRLWMRTVSHMAEEHYAVAVFRGTRRKGRGLLAHIAILVFAVECQIMSATLLFYLHSCYTLDSVFDDDALDIGTWVLNRVSRCHRNILLSCSSTKC